MDVKFVFGENEERVFDQRRTALWQEPVLKLYCPTAKTELHTDASALGYGTVLLQQYDQDRAWHPVYYASWKISPTEEKYDNYKLEVLSIIKALKKFRVYLIGIEFEIITVCQAFAQAMKKKNICAQVAGWALLFEQFRYEIIHRPGRFMQHVDALRRNPSPKVMLRDDYDESILHQLQRNKMSDPEIV